LLVILNKDCDELELLQEKLALLVEKTDTLEEQMAYLSCSSLSLKVGCCLPLQLRHALITYLIPNSDNIL
jgi:hypothetical protein